MFIFLSLSGLQLPRKVIFRIFNDQICRFLDNLGVNLDIILLKFGENPLIIIITIKALEKLTLKYLFTGISGIGRQYVARNPSKFPTHSSCYEHEH